MKSFAIIFCCVCCGLSVFGQRRKLPPKDSYQLIPNLACSYPKQTGKLEVVRDTSEFLTTYKTDSLEMYMYAGHFIGFLTAWNDSAGKSKEIYYRLDSLVTKLFKLGLLTPDLLCSSINAEMKVINNKGDTLDWTQHVSSKTVKLLNIQQKELPKKYKRNKKLLLFEIWATFNPYESGWGSFPMFDLYLSADIEVNSSNLNEFIERAVIMCLEYTGIQI